GNASPTPSLEHDFFKNVLRDQRAIWTSPFHIHRDQAYWLLPFAGVTAALLASDSATAEDGGEFAASGSHQKISDRISSFGTIYVPAAVVGSLYLVGRITGNNKARETAVLAAEAALDTEIVGESLKLILNRQRPSASDGEGEFWSRGSSFPSGHSFEAWSIATVIANEYHDHLWVEITAYAGATLVSASRFTGHHHYLSDILVGSAIGYGIGRYVYRNHHQTPGGSDSGTHHILAKIKSRLAMAPIYAPAVRTYGGSLSYVLW
ncbi:MAG TPA: phosphatase PAP2 family protein, partial [Blastocatellia bacterium]|nr:phosphatase PAP2 family protein [Blastocatellia bacterium]